VLTEEADINILLEFTNLLVGKPTCVIYFICIDGKCAIFFTDREDIILTCLVFLVGDIVMLQTNSRLFLELTESTRKGRFIFCFTMALGEGPYLSLSSLH
jgi:hypothetical protein